MNFIIVIVVDGSSDRIAAVVDCSIFEEGATANFCKFDSEYDIARDSLMVGFIVPLVVEQELNCGGEHVATLQGQAQQEQPPFDIAADDAPLDNTSDVPESDTQTQPSNSSSSACQANLLSSLSILLLLGFLLEVASV